MPPSIRFVLVRPRNSLNIGAVARAAANFSVRDIAAVDPYEPRWREAVSAAGAAAVLKQAKLIGLDEALADRDLVFGTAAPGRRPERPVVSVRGLRGWLAALRPARRRIAVLFGSERSGLTKEELGRCGALLEIPTDPRIPSMNLGQAAAIVAYELSPLLCETVGKRPSAPPLKGAEMERLVDRLASATKARMPKRMTDKTLRLRLRARLSRWGLNAGDAAFLQGLLKTL